MNSQNKTMPNETENNGRLNDTVCDERATLIEQNKSLQQKVLALEEVSDSR
jgi:hypothetical protein